MVPSGNPGHQNDSFKLTFDEIRRIKFPLINVTKNANEPTILGSYRRHANKLPLCHLYSIMVFFSKVISPNSLICREFKVPLSESNYRNFNSKDNATSYTYRNLYCKFWQNDSKKTDQNSLI
jgi:hypothetical protein